jgi:hypothetical protein
MENQPEGMDATGGGGGSWQHVIVTIWHRNDLSAFKTFRRLRNCFNYHQPKYEVFL